MRIRFVAMLVVALHAIPLGVSPGAAQVTDGDLSMLGLVFRNRFVPFSEAEGRPELASIVARVSELGRDGDPIERYKAMIEGIARMSLGRWDEGVEVASILDVDVSAKTYEPGARVPVRVAPLYDRADALTAGYSFQLDLIAPGGAAIYEGDRTTFDALAPLAGEVVVPPEAAPGRYVVRYSLWQAGASEPIVSTGRSIYVIEALEERLAALQFENRRAANRRGARTPSRAVAGTTVLWYLDQFERARSEWMAGAYMGYPVVLNAIFEQGTLMVEPLDFVAGFELAEAFVGALSRGQDRFVPLEATCAWRTAPGPTVSSCRFGSSCPKTTTRANAIRSCSRFTAPGETRIRSWTASTGRSRRTRRSAATLPPPSTDADPTGVTAATARGT